MTDQIDFYVVCLTDIPERYAHVARMKTIIPQLQVIEAINGNKFTKDDIIRLQEQGILSKELKRLRYSICSATLRNRPFKLGEVGCFLSHMKALNAVANGTKRGAIILEDDMLPVDDFIQKVDNILVQLPTDTDMVHLYVNPHQRKYFQKDLNIFMTPQGIIGLTCYYITKEAAKFAIDRIKMMLSPIDLVLPNIGLFSYVVSNVELVKNIGSQERDKDLDEDTLIMTSIHKTRTVLDLLKDDISIEKATIDNIDFYAICLVNEANRLGNCKKIKEIIPNLQIIEAIDGRKFTKTNLTYLQTKGILHKDNTKLIDNYNTSGRGNKISLGQLGAYLSHKRTLEMIATSSKPGGVVFEDDVTPVPDFLMKLQKVLPVLPNPIDILHLHVFPSQINNFKGHDIYNTPKGLWGLQCYYITRNGAKTALERLTPMMSAIDEMITRIGLYSYVIPHIDFITQIDEESCITNSKYIVDVLNED
jgi:GR25 family glycosyltransferase involved in LPS biosynthesis